MSSTLSKMNANCTHLPTPALLLALQANKENSTIACTDFYFLNLMLAPAISKWVPTFKIKHTLPNPICHIPGQYFNCELHSILQFIVLSRHLYYRLFSDDLPSTASPLQLTEVIVGLSLQVSFPYCFKMAAVELKLSLHLLSSSCPLANPIKWG